MRGKAVLVRADFNVPIAEVDGGRRVVDDFRIRSALPTLGWLVERGARVTACSHLGRPGGRPDPRFSMEPVRACLARLAPAVSLLENLRFDPGEEANDPAFVDRLVEGQDLYVDDAFGAAHRAHASIVGPPQRLPCAAGRLLAREVEVLSGLLESPERPFAAVLGGAKVSDKLKVIRALLERVEVVLVGGGMCFTFLVAAGVEVGDSLVEPAMVQACRDLLDSGRRIMLPSDFVALESERDRGSAGSGRVEVFSQGVPPGWRGLDVGPATREAFAQELMAARTILWNGPMGVFEDPRFAEGTKAVGDAVAASPAFSVVGGGDSAAALDSLGIADRIDHISTGGGATLELLESGDLPGLAALRAGGRVSRHEERRS